MTALAGFPELKLWPGNAAPTIANFTLNASTDAVEMVFQLPEDITIARLGFRQGTLTGVAPVFRVSLQGVDTSGNPDGTVKGATNSAYYDYTPTAGNNSTWQWVTLGETYAGTKGEFLSMVIAYQSGTIDGSNNCSFGSTSSIGSAPGQPYAIQNDAGSRTRPAATPIGGWGSSGTAYGIPISSVSTSGFSSSSTPDEKAVKFNLPTTLCSTYKVCGAVILGSLAAANTFKLTLYDTDGTTILQEITIDTDDDQAATNNRVRPYFFDDAPATLNAGSSYRLSMNNASASMILPSFTVANNADMDAYAWGASVATSSTRTDAGAWTDDVKTRYAINLILSDVTLPAPGIKSIIRQSIGTY